MEQMLGQLKEFLGPTLEAYGTGNIEIDLAILCGVALIATLLLLSGIVRMITGTGTPAILQELEELAPADLRIKIEKLEGDLSTMVEVMKGDSGYMKQELSEIREMLLNLASEVVLDRGMPASSIGETIQLPKAVGSDYR